VSDHLLKNDTYPAWIVPFLVGFSIGGLAGFFLL